MYRWLGCAPEMPELWTIDPDPDRNPLTPPPPGLMTGGMTFENVTTPGKAPEIKLKPESLAESNAFRALRLGVYGADRNGNRKFDQGPLGPGVRMRAVTVARFNFYDRITICSLRN
jgi:hypothetical protein